MKTRIISTIGPAADSRAMLEKLIRAGTGMFRFNFSHATTCSTAAPANIS